MALKRADIRKILENAETSNDEKAKAILDALHEETDALRDELDTEKAARTAAEKDRDAAANGKTIAEKALDDYKKEQTAKDTRASKTAAYKQLLKDNGVLEKHIDRVIRMTGADIDNLELNDKGEVKDAKKFMDGMKSVWGDFAATTTTKGAQVDTPPANPSGVSLEEFHKMSLDERIKFKAENTNLYNEYRHK